MTFSTLKQSFMKTQTANSIYLFSQCPYRHILFSLSCGFLDSFGERDLTLPLLQVSRLGKKLGFRIRGLVIPLSAPGLRSSQSSSLLLVLPFFLSSGTVNLNLVWSVVRHYFNQVFQQAVSQDLEAIRIRLFFFQLLFHLGSSPTPESVPTWKEIHFPLPFMCLGQDEAPTCLSQLHAGDKHICAVSLCDVI